MSSITSLSNIKEANRHNGGYWFDKDTLRFFGSRVSERVYPFADGCAFVSSEQDKTGFGCRLYTVRACNMEGAIDTVGDFGAYRSASGAHAAAKRYAESKAHRLAVLVYVLAAKRVMRRGPFAQIGEARRVARNVKAWDGGEGGGPVMIVSWDALASVKLANANAPTRAQKANARGFAAVVAMGIGGQS